MENLMENLMENHQVQIEAIKTLYKHASYQRWKYNLSLTKGPIPSMI